MNLTAEMNTSARQGSNCLPVILHNSLNIEYGFWPINSKGLLMPKMFRYRIVAGPTLGILVKSYMSVLFFILCFEALTSQISRHCKRSVAFALLGNDAILSICYSNPPHRLFPRKV